jgi:hypothetical protein
MLSSFKNLSIRKYRARYNGACKKPERLMLFDKKHP